MPPPNNNSQNSLAVKPGTNAAPLKPLIDLRDKMSEQKIENHPVCRQLKEKYEDLIIRDQESWREMIGVAQQVTNFIEGNQVLEYNRFDYSYRPRKSNNDPNIIRAINLTRFYATNWLDKWGSSNPDIYVSPLSNADQARTQARKANSVVDYLESRFYNPFFVYQEGLQALTTGWYARQVEADFESKSFSALRDVIEEKEVDIGEGFGMCADCGYRGSDTAQMPDTDDDEAAEMKGMPPMPACPECKSQAFLYEPPIKQIMEFVTGQEKIFLPEIKCGSLSLASTRFDLKCRAEDSSWLITEKKIQAGALRRMLGDLRVPDGESGNEFGLRAIEEMARAGAALAGQTGVAASSGKNANAREFTFSKMYLSADDLEDIKIGGDEETVSRFKLPKGKRMSETHPDGACVVGINGMSLIIGIFADHHSKSVSSGVYHVKPHSGTGRGAADTLEIQKQFNRRHGQIDKFFSARSTPATLFMEGAIKPEHRKMLGKSDVNIPVQMQNFPEVRDVSQLIRPMQGESVPGDLYNYTFEHLRSLFEVTAHITDFSGGASPSVNNKTATGAQILDANANSLFSPTLSIKADVALQTAKKAFGLFCEHTPVSRFLPFKSRSKTGSFGIAVSGEEVKGEYDWQIVPGSEQPRNAFHKAQTRAQFFSQFQGGVMGWLQARAQNPAEIAELERDADVEFATDSYDLTGEVCRNRWEAAKAMLPQTDTPLPMEAYLQILMNLDPSMLITEPHLREKTLWFSELLDTDEGQQMSKGERSLCSAFIVGLKMLANGQEIEIGQQETEKQIAIQQPAQEAQAAQQQQQMAMQQQAQAGQQAAQAQQQTAQTQAQAQTAASQQEGEAASREQADDHKLADLANDQMQRDHDMKIAQMNQQSQVK